jgi:hypothetical protein
VAALLVAVAAAACGNGDGDGGAQEGGSERSSSAGPPPEDFVERVAQLLETSRTRKDCRQLDEISQRSVIDFSCPPTKDVRASMKDFEVVDGERYGTAAVVDYKSGVAKNGGAVLLHATPAGAWGVSGFGILTPPSTGTDDGKVRGDYETAVEEYLLAVRNRDCGSYLALVLTGRATKGEICRTAFAETAPLAKRLKADPSAKSLYMGGNATFGFFEIATRKPSPERSTISVARASNGGNTSYVVLGLSPSSPSASADSAVKQ